MEQVVAYKVIDKIKLKHLYLAYHISRITVIYKKMAVKFTKLIQKRGALININARETVASRWFMRGTDPTKSTWVYPKLIL